MAAHSSENPPAGISGGHSALGASTAGPPLRPAVRAGNLIFVSGQIGSIRTMTRVVVGGVRAETRQALANIGRILHEMGLSYRNVVKCTVLLTDMGDYAAMNDAYAGVFREAPPARTAYAVSALPFGARVEIECIAVDNRGSASGAFPTE